MSDQTDRELLELAAKAAGVPSKVVGASPGSYWIEETKSMHLQWNPLTDDGDALRLAVKLGMQVDMRDPETRIYAMGAGDVVTEYHANRDPLAATRRAIVRAAAALTQGA